MSFWLDKTSLVQLNFYIYWCLDVDECATNDGGCLHGCENSIGSFVCNCPIGLVSSAGNHCIGRLNVSIHGSLNFMVVCL